jgi:hypothetical protein
VQNCGRKGAIEEFKKYYVKEIGNIFGVKL